MTYEAEVQFKFDATYTPTYGSSSWAPDDFVPEEHYLITAPAADLNAKQYFKLFEKFLLCVGMDPVSIRSAAMSLVFNDMVSEEDQRKVCKEYELTMDEDLHDRFKEWKRADEDFARLQKGTVQYTDTELDAMCDAAEEKEKCREYNLREAEYLDKRAKIDLQQQTDLIGLDAKMYKSQENRYGDPQ